MGRSLEAFLAESPAATKTAGWRRFGADESGATAVEYALITFMISIAVLVAVQAVGLSLNNFFTDLATTLQTIAGGP